MKFSALQAEINIVFCLLVYSKSKNKINKFYNIMIQLQYKISTEVNLKHLKYLVNHNLKCSTKLVNKNIKLCCQRTHIPWLPANIKQVFQMFKIHFCWNFILQLYHDIIKLVYFILWFWIHLFCYRKFMNYLFIVW
jgi:hypothetical protein